MCNNAYDDYIDDFCYNHNQDYSPKFVTILIAATISAKDVSANKTCLYTLPVWYAYRAKGTVSADALRHTDGVGGGSIFSTANTTDDWASVRDSYTTNAPDIRQMHTDDANYGLPYWWTKKKAALSVAPTGVDGSTPGNVGYTYISTVGIEIDPIDEDKNKSSSSSGGSGSGSVDNIQNLIDRIDLEFYISVESDEYMLRATESGGDVDQQQVTVTIDFRQDDTTQQNIKLLYDYLANDSTNWETGLSIVVEREFNTSGANDSSGVADDANLNSYFNNYVNLTENTIAYYWNGIDWDTAYYVFGGHEQIQFTDRGIKIDTSAGMTETIATYHCAVKFVVYESGNSDPIWSPSYSVYANGTGKYECDSSCAWSYPAYCDVSYMAHDYASWVYLNPEDVAYYTSLNPDNYAELKHNDVGSETYEAMAGIPTDENLRQAAEVA